MRRTPTELEADAATPAVGPNTTTWRDFIRRHMDVLAGTDFFTVEVLTWRGLVTYYVLFFISCIWTAGGSPSLASPIVRRRAGCVR